MCLQGETPRVRWPGGKLGTRGLKKWGKTESRVSTRDKGAGRLGAGENLDSWGEGGGGTGIDGGKNCGGEVKGKGGAGGKTGSYRGGGSAFARAWGRPVAERGLGGAKKLFPKWGLRGRVGHMRWQTGGRKM